MKWGHTVLFATCSAQIAHGEKGVPDVLSLLAPGCGFAHSQVTVLLGGSSLTLCFSWLDLNRCGLNGCSDH